MTAAVEALVEERVRFGRAIPAAVNALLQQAAARSQDFAASEQALLQARLLAPRQLEVFIALYKLYFYRGLTAKAEKVVLEALHSAAHLKGEVTLLPQVVRGAFAATLVLLAFLGSRRERASGRR